MDHSWISHRLGASLCLLFLVAAGPAGAQFSSAGRPDNETLLGEPSCLSWPQADTSSQCYVRGGSGTLWQVRSTDSVTVDGGWKPLGGSLASDPVCVSPTRSEVACFATFVDGALWRNSSLDGGQTFGGWWLARGSFTGKPSCVAIRPREFDCFVLGTDGNVIRVSSSGGAMVVRSAIGSGPFVASDPTSPLSMGGVECVQTLLGTRSGARCFAARPDGSLWTVETGDLNPPDPSKIWTEIGEMRSRGGIDCFAWPFGRIDCFAATGTTVRHFSNVPLPPSVGRTQPWQSAGFFFAESSAPTHPLPVRCIRNPVSAAINCVVVAWSDQSVDFGPLQLNRLRFNEDAGPPRDPESFGGDLASVPSCVLVAVQQTPTTLATSDTACFALASTGDLVYLRLDPPVILGNPLDTLRPARPINLPPH